MTLVHNRKQLFIGLVALVGILAGSAWVGYGQTHRLYRNSALVAHTHEVLATLERVIASLTDAETSQRGYLITEDPEYLDLYEVMCLNLPQTIRRLRDLTDDNPRQQERIVRLEELSAKRIAVLAEGIELGRTGHPDAARDVIVSGRGRAIMQAIRSLIQEMEQEERDLLASRDRENSRAYQSALLSGVAGLLFGIGAVGAFLWLLLRYIQTTTRSTALMYEQKTELMKQTAALRDADRRKDEFLAILAHELRNPLSPISNALQVWKLVENDPSQMQQLHQMMERQVQQLTRLIDDLLDVSRITRGKLELRKEPVPLATAVRDAVEAARPLLDGSEHQLAINLGETPLVVEGDKARLTQIFANILQNAATFTEHRGRIEIRAHQDADKGVVSIKDNGPGIPDSMLSRIFEMFQQVDQSLERSRGGLGIGLTLVKRLVDLHGGHVEAHSDGPGQGSEFVVTLPLMASKPGEPQAGASGTGNAARTTLPPFKVLVVDDVHASAKTLALMLRAIGQDVEVIHDGSAAVDWVIEHRPDFAFLDIAMPGMNGYEVARRIREREELRDVYLVALTGYGQEEDRRRARDSGFDQHLTKPTSIDRLKQLLVDNAPCQRAGREATSAVGVWQRPQ